MKMVEAKKKFDLSVLYDNLYHLLFDDELFDEGDSDTIDIPVKVLRRVDKASQVTKEITSILKEAAKKIKSLEKHRFGIGDTDTDEQIVAEFYSYIH
jgi:hypothetical protein